MDDREHIAIGHADGGQRAATADRDDVLSCGAAKEVHADQVCDIARARSLGNLRRRSRLQHAAMLEHDETVRHGHRLHRVVRHQQPHATERLEVLSQLSAKLDPGADIQGRHWFVEEQERRVSCQRPDQRNPLRLATRQGAGFSIGRRAEADAVQPRSGPGGCGCPPHPARPESECHVLQDRQVREEQVVLEDYPDRPLLHGHADRVRRFIQHDAVQRDAPGIDGQQPGKGAQHRGLARTVRPQQGDDLAWCDAEIDIQVEASHPCLELRLKAHDVPSQRSRSPTRTASETRSKTRLSRMADCGLDSNAR